MNNLKKLFHGAICFLEKENYIIPRRFTLEQTALFPETHYFHGRTLCGASITLELTTDADTISFAYKFFYRSGVKSTFEIYTNGFLTHLLPDSDMQDEGVLEFSFEKGEKHIEIYIPNYSEVGIKNLTINGEYKPVAKKRNKVLFIGDSITQGGGSRRSGQTYVNVVKRALNYEVLNQGIGGYYCDEDILQDIPFVPKKIVVAFGTNHRVFAKEENTERTELFFKALHKRYPNVKKLVILPPYYGSEQTEEMKKRFKKIKEILMNTTAQYSNITTVSAYDMIPHFIEYYLDDFVHPNALGMEVYGQNLVKIIKKIGF